MLGRKERIGKHQPPMAKKTQKKKVKRKTGRIRLKGKRKLEAQKRLATIKEWGDRAFKKTGKRKLPPKQAKQAKEWLQEIRDWREEEAAKKS
ncbi:hypothetical protein BKI52_33105 [marine bacterium AO1-C]|nr:hypothetical protein BKI52_33105 [marine bacterium AO1-C]